MDKRLVVLSTVIQCVILACFVIAYVLFRSIWILISFVITEILYISILNVAINNKYGYGGHKSSKHALESANTHLSATELKEWVRFSNNWSEAETTMCKRKETIRKVDTLEEAERQWQTDRRTQKGAALYERILSNWETYIAVCGLNKNISETRKCELEIIRFMFTDNASIKHQEAIIQICTGDNWTRETTLEALDQLLIRRIVVIALEGSLDYYRINSGWNILRDIEREKQVLIEQDAVEERKRKPKQNVPRQVLSQTRIEKHEAEEIAKSVTYYREQTKNQVIECLETALEPITIVEMLARYRELGTINQLVLEEIMKELVQKGQAITIEDAYPVKYRLVNN